MMQKLTVTITSLLENLPTNDKRFLHAFTTFTCWFNLAGSRTMGAGLANTYRLVRAVTFCTTVAAYLLTVSTLPRGLATRLSTDGLECVLSTCTWGRGCLNRVRELDLAGETRNATCTSRRKEIRISHFPFCLCFWYCRQDQY